MNLRQAAQQALEALEWNYNNDLDNIPACEQWAKMLNETITALKQALAEPEQKVWCDCGDSIEPDSGAKCGNCVAGDSAEPEQEPVAWNWMQDGQPYSPAYYGPPPDDDVVRIGLANGRSVRLLYTAPTPRRPLTDEEIIEHFEAEVDTGLLSSFADGVRFAERAHGITGERHD